MKRILFLTEDLHYRGNARQISLLAPALARAGHQVEVAALKAAGPLASAIQQAGIPIRTFAGQKLFDLDDWLSLRQYLGENRDQLHVFGWQALGTLAWATWRTRRALPPIWLSGFGRELSRKKPSGFFARRRFNLVAQFIADGDWDAAMLQRWGVSDSRIRIARPVVAMPPLNKEPRDLRRELGLPAESQLIMTIGRFSDGGRLGDAVWGFDVLRYVYPQIHLVMVGDGPGRPAMERFARDVGIGDDRVHFLGWSDDAAGLVGAADMVWLPQRTAGGTNVALEAMAAGKPLVAADLPNLHGIVESGKTGVTAPIGDPTAFARAAKRIIDDPAWARSLGDAAKEMVARRHAIDSVNPGDWL